MMARFVLGGSDGADRRGQAAVIGPVDPLQGGILDRLEGALRPAPMDHPRPVRGKPPALNGPSIVTTPVPATHSRWSGPG
ncbi:hypothetical protein EU555_13045 [Methylobacterium nonmethylotrophicum]|uniref:Uncharacterized protein n=1 Tax=Methylobacterium nonmethylotrophicum TaxID=1141884 RepID=A0A4Z0NSS8_9HYPH|nr:hypothetical protein EU555_13045 [Methylobacterium nonmethylotrophicum]